MKNYSRLIWYLRYKNPPPKSFLEWISFSTVKWSYPNPKERLFPEDWEKLTPKPNEPPRLVWDSVLLHFFEKLEIVSSPSTAIKGPIENVKKGVFSGDTLTKLFLKEPTFPPTFSQLISVGEQTGNLDEMFNSVSSYYEEEFDTAVDNMSSLIEPIMIVFMGTMIGGLMIAMYSPIFNVGALIG